jgi:IclR family transcriptional regulator, acetate operon repressor
MGTVSKALALLDILAVPQARLGLTEIARLADYDKATTRRFLVELKASGFVEQDDQTRDYMLGPSLLRLGRVREERFPFFRIAQPVVRFLAEASGETAHASEFGGGVMNSVCVQASDKSNRVIIEVGEKLPLHATASGIAFLAAAPAAVLAATLAKPLPRFSEKTETDPAALADLVAQARSRGYSQSDQLKETGVHSVAAAILNPRQAPVGAIAVAMPSTRSTPAILAQCGALVQDAAAEISARLFGAAAPRKVNSHA